MKSTPRRVLFIENSIGLSGSTVSLATLLRRLDRSRFVPCVVVSRPEQATFLRQQLGESTEVAVIRPASGLKGTRWLRRALGPSGREAKGLRRAAWRAAGLFDMLTVSLHYSLRLRRFAQRHQIALIHQNNGFDIGAVFLAGMLGVPMVAYQRGDEWNSPIVRWLATRVTRFIANSIATRRSLDSLGIPPERVRVIYPPVDLESFTAKRRPEEVRESLGLQVGVPCFGMIGMLIPWKGHEVFLRAAAHVFERLPHARAIIVGGPPPEGDAYANGLRDLAKKLSIQDRVIFTGFRPDVADIMSVLDTVVHASVEPEPFGRVIVEAMAMCRPIVASRAGGPTEIIEHGQTGFLVPPGDADTLAARLIDLLEDPERAADIAKRAYREVTRRFSAKTNAHLIQDVYDEVLRPYDVGRPTIERANAAPMRNGHGASRPDRLRHALFVAFHFPPEASSSGVLRTLKYARYLGAHGWRVTVLTLDRSAYAIQDPGLESQIPADVRVVRTAFFDIKRHLAIRGVYPGFVALPDRWVGWWPWAVRAGREVVQTDPIDLIYSTSPHATAHLVALSLARRARCPWVADFRDPWYEEPPEPGTPRLVHRAARHLERLVVRRADRVLATTERLRDDFASRYASEPPEKFSAIPNGYDEEDFSGLPRRGGDPGTEFLILHAGSVNPTFRDPRPVFVAVREAVDAGAIDISKVRFRFLGAGAFGESPEMKQAIEAAGLSGRVVFRPRVEYARALTEMTQACLLLLLQESRDTESLVPAKLFEYLRAGRPVLAVVRPGATAEVLRAVGAGWAVDPRALGDLREGLIEAYRAWRSGTLDRMVADPQALSRFSRQRLASELATQFDSLARKEKG
jgi:glycosyltransferase involved in cell wall biosynthesis